MAVNKTEILNMRVRPQTKRALRAIAEREKRSMANAVECLVDEYVTRNQIQIPRLNSDRSKAHSGKGSWS
jgi:hypothetical protein